MLLCFHLHLNPNQTLQPQQFWYIAWTTMELATYSEYKYTGSPSVDMVV